MQQMPDIEWVDFKREILCPKCTIHNDRRKQCADLKTDKDKLNIVVCCYEIYTAKTEK